jgi:hypothetical protein
MKKKIKIWKFPCSAIVKNDKGELMVSVATQVYQIGIYACASHLNSHGQHSFTPAQAVKYMKSFEQSNLLPGYTSKMGREITVTIDENGFYKKIEV